MFLPDFHQLNSWGATPYFQTHKTMMRWVSHAQALTDPAAAELNHQHLEFVFKQTWESNYQILAKMDKHSG